MSAKQTIRDRQNKIIGYIVTRPDGKQQAETFSGRILGYYDPKRDRTEDFGGRTVGYGNLLVTLLPPR